ncbi:MAG: hypothetical protein KJ065_25995, partial [Anaerolineae bacterium]|nr:hypothetical protein [Anaerolineae bacterium]
RRKAAVMRCRFWAGGWIALRHSNCPGLKKRTIW